MLESVTVRVEALLPRHAQAGEFVASAAGVSVARVLEGTAAAYPAVRVVGTH